MIDTIYKIGKEISVGRDPWKDIIERKLKANKKGKDLTLLKLTIVFDLDNSEVIIEKDNLAELDDSFEALKELVYLKTLGRRMKSPYLCVESDKIYNLFKALFGEIGKENRKGELLESMEGIDFEDEIFFEILEKVFSLKSKFQDILSDSSDKINSNNIKQSLELSANERLALVYPSIIYKKLGIENKPLQNFDGYKGFIKRKFINSKSPQSNKKGLCYVTGDISLEIKEMKALTRYNINKLFVQETKNFASNFSEKNFIQNYQISENTLSFLNRGSDYLLENLVLTIAGIRHLVIPQFFNSEKITRERLKFILTQSELLFDYKQLKELDAYFSKKSLEESYWLNFLAIDSDGNYFKASNLIKDVSNFHFNNVLRTLAKSGELFSPWLGDQYVFNFYLVFKIIPARKENQNQNKSLLFFGSILENRKIEIDRIYQNFTELILCHWYQRYKSYSNIYSHFNDFDFAAKDAVFKYLALIHSLKQLNLIKNFSKMEDMTITSESISKELESFFSAMDYTPSQQALFYLGRALSQIAYEQGKKGNKKTVLNKLNYNGMDKRSIYRLSTDLFEKGKQYDFVDKIQWNLGEFNQRFDFNNWNMNPQEALFFLLTGYTFRIKSNVEPISETN